MTTFKCVRRIWRDSESDKNYAVQKATTEKKEIFSSDESKEYASSCVRCLL